MSECYRSALHEIYANMSQNNIQKQDQNQNLTPSRDSEYNLRSNLKNKNKDKEATFIVKQSTDNMLHHTDMDTDTDTDSDSEGEIDSESEKNLTVKIIGMGMGATALLSPVKMIEESDRVNSRNKHNILGVSSVGGSSLGIGVQNTLTHTHTPLTASCVGKKCIPVSVSVTVPLSGSVAGGVGEGELSDDLKEFKTVSSSQISDTEIGEEVDSGRSSDRGSGIENRCTKNVSSSSNNSSSSDGSINIDSDSDSESRCSESDNVNNINNVDNMYNENRNSNSNDNNSNSNSNNDSSDNNENDSRSGSVSSMGKRAGTSSSSSSTTTTEVLNYTSFHCLNSSSLVFSSFNFISSCFHYHFSPLRSSYIFDPHFISVFSFSLSNYQSYFHSHSFSLLLYISL